MLELPVTFRSRTEAEPGVSRPWRIEAGSMSSVCAVPVEFGGGGGAFSPEDLFAQALANCFVGTFQVYAANSRVAFSRISVSADLVVDRDESGQPWMKECRLHIRIEGAEKVDRVRVLAEKALRSGFILNSVKTRIEPSLEIQGNST